LLLRQVDGQQFVAVLHRHIGRGALAVDPDMAGRLAGGDAFGQGQVPAVPAVDVDMVEPVRRRDEPLHIGGETQLVGVEDATHGTLDFGRARIDKGQRVAEGIGDDQRLLVGGQIEVMRLLAGGKSLDLLPADRVVTLTSASPG
jgi:hypothetical protein